MAQSRWRSAVAWTAALAVFVLIGDNYGLWEIIKMPSETFQAITNGIIGILVMFGIFNNPTNKEGF
jgi:uncharacterized membrane protein